MFSLFYEWEGETTKMKLSQLAKQLPEKLSKEQQKCIDDLDLCFLKEVNFEENDAFCSGSPRIWRQLVYEEIMLNEGSSDVDISYRSMREKVNIKLLRRFVEKAQEDGQYFKVGDGNLLILALNVDAMHGYYKKDEIQNGLITPISYVSHCDDALEHYLCRSHFYLQVEQGAVAVLGGVSLSDLPNDDELEHLCDVCGGHGRKILFYAFPTLRYKLKAKYDFMKYKWRDCSWCVMNEIEDILR